MKKASIKILSISDWKELFLLIICVLTLILSIMSVISTQEQRASIERINNRIDQYAATADEVNSNTILKSNAYIEFCEAINNRADSEFNKLITIVGIFASVITLLGVLITFKAPKDLERDISDLRKLTNKTSHLIEEQEYLLSISDALMKKTTYHRIKALSDIINKHPNKWQAYKYRGDEYEDSKSYNDAINDYKSAKCFGCKNEIYYNCMSIAISNRYSITNDITDQEQALRYISKAIEINPEDPVYYNNRGSIYCEMNKFEDSIHDFDIAISIDPNNYEAYANKAIAYAKKSQTSTILSEINQYKQLAITYIKKALELNSEDSDDLTRLTQLLSEELFNENEETEHIPTASVDENIVGDLSLQIHEKIGDISFNNEDYINAITGFINALIIFNTPSEEVIYSNISTIDRICNKIYKCKEKMPSIDISDSINRKLHILIIVLSSIAYNHYKKNDYINAGKLFEYATILSGLGTSSSNNLAYMIRRKEYTCDIYKITDLLGCKTPDETSSFLRINRALCMISGIGFEANVTNALKEINVCEDELPNAVQWWSNDTTVGKEESNLVLLLLSIMNKVELDEDNYSVDTMIHQAISDGYNLPNDLLDIAVEILNAPEE